MILEEATKEAYGYWPKDIMRDSPRLIITLCEFCNDVRVVYRFMYRTFNCLSCDFINKRDNVQINPMFGKHHTDEAKAKSSTSHKGRTHTDEAKANISAAKKGKKRKAFTKEHKANMSAANKGEKGNNWQGGKSFEPYCVKFNSTYKREIRKLFSNKCFLCNMTTEENGRALDVHHVNYNKQCGCDGEKCICVPLCVHCHIKTNFNRGYWERKIRGMLD